MVEENLVLSYSQSDSPQASLPTLGRAVSASLYFKIANRPI
jgi:hypothetical protein